MARILILVGAHLCMAPRPLKEADALAAAGHEVTIGCLVFDDNLLRTDSRLAEGRGWRVLPYADMRPSRRFLRARLRVRRRMAGLLHLAIGLESFSLLGYGAREMLRLARRQAADLTIVHSEAGLWTGTRLLAEGRRVGVDFEDWYSADLEPEQRRGRPVALLRSWEEELLKHCDYALAPSRAMAQALATEYGVAQPTVVRNVFPLAAAPRIAPVEGTDRPISLHWYSQTIGPGRGLELLMQSLHHLLAPVRVVLRGRCSEEYRATLLRLAPTSCHDRIEFLPPVAPQELGAEIARHDIGLALELPDIPSRNLTITNKVFEYLRGGLAVIATATAGQREVFADNPEIGIVLPRNEPADLAAAITTLVSDPLRLASARLAARAAFERELHWEREAAVVVGCAEKALSRS